MDKKDGGTIDLESLRGFTPGPHPVAKANHGSDHYTIGDGPPFIGVARKEADAQLFAVAYAMHAELTARRARDAEPSAECWRKAVQEFRQWGNVDDANAIQQRAAELAKQP